MIFSKRNVSPPVQFTSPLHQSSPVYPRNEAMRDKLGLSCDLIVFLSQFGTLKLFFSASFSLWYAAKSVFIVLFASVPWPNLVYNNYFVHINLFYFLSVVVISSLTNFLINNKISFSTPCYNSNNSYNGNCHSQHHGYDHCYHSTNDIAAVLSDCGVIVVVLSDVVMSVVHCGSPKELMTMEQLPSTFKWKPCTAIVELGWATKVCKCAISWELLAWPVPRDLLGMLPVVLNFQNTEMRFQWCVQHWVHTGPVDLYSEPLH